MTVVVPWYNKKFQICDSDCKYTGMYISICPDEEQNSRISNMLPGLFDRKWKIIEVLFEEK